MAALKFAYNIADILNGHNIAIVGASHDTHKFGYAVYKALKQAGYNVYAVHPNADEMDGDTVYPWLDNVPVQLDCVVTVVPPEVTYEIVRQAGRLHIPHVWMQPGSESEAAIIEAQSLGIAAVYGGPCIMVEADQHQTKQPANARRT